MADTLAPDKGVCRLCGGPIGSAEVAVAFPAGVFKPRDPAAALNDSTVHFGCLEDQDFGFDALSKLDAYNRRRFVGERSSDSASGMVDELTPMGRVGLGALLLALCAGVGVFWGRKAWAEGDTAVHAAAIAGYLLAIAVGVRMGRDTFRQILVLSLDPEASAARRQRSRAQNRRWAWPSTFFAVAVVSGRLASSAWANLSVSLIGALCAPAMLLMMAAWLVRNRNQTRSHDQKADHQELTQEQLLVVVLSLLGTAAALVVMASGFAADQSTVGIVGTVLAVAAGAVAIRSIRRYKQTREPVA